MRKNPKKIIAFLFIIATITSSALMAYTFNFYLGTYQALRTIKISVQKFYVKKIDTTSAEIESIVGVSNPTSYEFQALGVEQGIFFDNQYLAYARSQDPSFANPLQVLPNSSNNITVVTNISPEKATLLISNHEKRFWVSIRVDLEGPLIGRFYLTTFEQV